MTPPKSLMALLACALFAPAAAGAADWTEIRTKTQSYFVHPDDQAQYESMQKSTYPGPLWLWVNQKAKAEEKEPTKVKSGGALGCEWAIKGKEKKWKCHIKVNKASGGNYTVAVDIKSVVKPIPVAEQPARNAAVVKPENVSQEVWAAVVNSGIAKDKWVKTAQLLEKAQASTSPAAAKLKGASTADYEKAIKQIADDVGKNTKDDEIVTRVISLAEKFPAPPGSSSGNVPTAGGKPVGGDPSKTGPGGSGENLIDDAALNQLAKKLAEKTVQADMAKRITAYLSGPTGQDAFMVVPNKEAGLKILAGAVEGWTAKQTATETGRSRAAVLYFMAGEAAALPWMDTVELKSITQPFARRDGFNSRMKLFTVAGGKAANPSEAQSGPFTGEPDWVPGALFRAMDFAEAAWREKRTNGEIEGSVRTNENGVVVPSQVGKGGLAKDYQARAFSGKDMYEGPACIVQNVLVPGSEPPMYRRISMRIYSGATDWGPPTRTIEKIGIFDITDMNGGGYMPGRYFPINTRGSMTIPIDDSQSGTIKYKLTFEGGKITFNSVNKKGEPTSDEPPFKTSVTDLYGLRAKELIDEKYSYRANLGGREYRVIGQGGDAGGLLYFEMDGSGSKPLRDSPDFAPDLTRVDKNDGKTRNIPEDRPIGAVRKADGTYEWWYMVWNVDKQMYEQKKKDAKPTTDPRWKPKPTEEPKKEDPKKPDGQDGGGEDKPDEEGGGNPNPGDGTMPDGSKDPTLNSCASTNEYKGTATPSVFYREQNKFKLYTQVLGKDVAMTDVNSTYLCLHKELAIFFPGLVGKEEGSVAVEGEYLRVRTVIPGAYDSDKGYKLLKPDQAAKVYGKGENLMWKDDAGTEKKLCAIDAGADYYIPINGLDKAIKGDKNVPLANVNKVAWVKVERNYSADLGKNPVLQIFVHPGDDAAAVILKAIKLHAENTICTEGAAVAPKIVAYINKAVADPELGVKLKDFAKEVAGPSGVNASAPSMAMTCRAQATAQLGSWALAVPSWNSSKTLMALDGKIDESTGYK